MCVHVLRDDGEASGESVNDDWIFNTIIDKKPKQKQNGVINIEEPKPKEVRNQISASVIRS